MILLDTNVVIEIMKDRRDSVELVNSIGLSNISISAITEMELYYGAFNKKEQLKIKESIHAFNIIALNENITAIATDLIVMYSKSHGLNIPDALIAATAIHEAIPLLTYNTKDFQAIKQLVFFKRKSLDH